MTNLFAIRGGVWGEERDDDADVGWDLVCWVRGVGEGGWKGTGRVGLVGFGDG
jgi:hypothetical protein